MFNWIVKLTNWVSKTIFSHPDSTEQTAKTQEKPQAFFFNGITEVQKTPNNASIEKHRL